MIEVIIKHLSGVTLVRNVRHERSFSFSFFIFLFVGSMFLMSSIAQAQLTAVFQNQKDACDGLNNGSVEILVTNSSGTITVDVFGPPNFPGIMPTDGVPEPITGMTPRSYVVVVQDDDETLVLNLTINNIVPNLSASLNSITNNTNCPAPNGAIDITVSGGTGSYSFAWTGPGSFSATTEDISGLLGGDYSVTVFDNGTNCSRSLGPLTVTDPVILVQNITTPDPVSVCPSTNITVSLGGSEVGITYEILVNGLPSGFTTVGPGGGGPINIVLPTGNYSDGDVLTVEGFEGLCPRILMNGSTTVSVNILSVAPTSASVDNANYCDDAVPPNITLSYSGGTLGTGATAKWYSDATFTTNVGSGTPLTIAAPATTTTYYVRFEGTCNTTTAQTVTVTVDAASVAPTSASVDNPNYCDTAAPANITLTYSGGTLGTGATAEWYSDGTFTTNVGSGTPLTIAAPATTTTYFVRFEGICGNTSAQSVTVTVDIAPSATITGPTASCPNQTQTYSVPAGATNYVWTLTGGDGTISSGAGTESITVDWVSVGGDLSVQVTGAAPSNCMANSTISVAVVTNSPALAPQSVDACKDGGQPSLDANPVLGATVKWYTGSVAPGNLLFTGNPYTPASSELDVTTLGTTTFVITQDIGCGESAGANFDVNIVARPEAGNDSTTSTCVTGSIIDLFPILGGTPDSGGVWSDDDASGALAGSMFDPGVSGTGTFNFTYLVNGTGGCTGVMDSALVTVNVVATSNPPVPDQTSYMACRTGTPPTLGATGVSLAWYADAGLTSLLVNGAIFTPVDGVNIDMSVDGTTSFFVTQDEGCGPGTAAQVDVVVALCTNCAFTIQVQTTPATCTIAPDGSRDGTVTLQIATGTNNDPQYTITDSLGSQTVQNNDTFVNLSPGTYSYIAEDLTAACQVSGQFTILLENTRVTATIQKDGDIACFGSPTGGTARITVTGGANPYEYKVGSDPWISFNSGDQIQGLPAGVDYSILVRDDATDLCPFSVTISISEPSAIMASIGTVNDTYPEQNIGSIKINDITSDNPPYQVQLLDGTGGIYFDFTDAVQDRFGIYNFEFTQLPADNYLIVVRDSTGCDLSLAQAIINKSDVFIPNIFTPNNDGVNEFFKVLNKQPNTKISIANRWGVKVFDSNDYQNDWQAQGVPDGVYFYTIDMGGTLYKGAVEVWRGGAKINN